MGVAIFGFANLYLTESDNDVVFVLVSGKEEQPRRPLGVSEIATEHEIATP